MAAGQAEPSLFSVFRVNYWILTSDCAKAPLLEIKIGIDCMRDFSRSTSRRKTFCFVTETRSVDNCLLDPSARYRCYHPAEELIARGHICEISSAKRFFRSPTLNYDVYIFHRPNYSQPGFVDIINFLHKQGAIVMADYDDLIFGSEEVAVSCSAVKNGLMTEEQAISAFENNANALKCFRIVRVSTQPLGQRVREINPEASVLVEPNFIPKSVLSVNAMLGTHLSRRPPKKHRIFRRVIEPQQRFSHRGRCALPSALRAP
ncbi:hypothetical protein V6767_21610 [Martelella sp. FLE1502]